jgi:probable phosphomutase (TIGR03848 family)
MTTVLLVRHGRSTANTSGILAGHSPGVHLDEVGRQQAERLAERLEGLPLAAAISSPLERCLETAQLALAGRPLTIVTEDRVAECRYGDWTGRELKTLVDDPMWKVVQQHPSAAVFPGIEGEPLQEVQNRSVAAIREWNAWLGPEAVYAVFSHGDVIKSVLADALGLHLDQFQRIVVDPCSVSVVTYTPGRPFVHRMNDTSGLLNGFAPRPAAATAASGSDATGADSSDAVVGGGSGSDR